MSGNNEGSNPLRRPMVGSRQQPVQQQLVLQSGQTLTVVPQQATSAQLFSGVVVASSSPSVQLPSSSNSAATTYLLQPQQPTSTRSATGGTIHHLGQSPTRTTPAAVLVPPANPSQQLQQSTMTTQHLQGLVSQLAQQQQTPPRAATSTASAAPATPTSASAATQLVFHSPLASPARGRKRVKLEEKPPGNEQVAKMRKIVEESKMNELLETKENYHENLTELFYLQSGWSFIDYLSWKKKPTAQLVELLKSATLDSDDEEDIPAKKKKVPTATLR